MNNETNRTQADELRNRADSEHTEQAHDEQTAEASAPKARADEEVSAEQPIETVDDLRAKVASLEDLLLRAKAEYQNFQRRSAQDRGQAVRYANAELMRALLGVLDDFERSLEAAQGAETATSVVDGVRLVYDNLMQALRIHGLESIGAVDRPFDPSVHEAIMQQPSADHPPDTVLVEVAKGYSLGERVLRPAKVIVSKGVETAQQEASEPPAPAELEEQRKGKKSKKKNRAG